MLSKYTPTRFMSLQQIRSFLYSILLVLSVITWAVGIATVVQVDAAIKEHSELVCRA